MSKNEIKLDTKATTFPVGSGTVIDRLHKSIKLFRSISIDFGIAFAVLLRCFNPKLVSLPPKPEWRAQPPDRALKLGCTPHLIHSHLYQSAQHDNRWFYALCPDTRENYSEIETISTTPCLQLNLSGIDPESLVNNNTVLRRAKRGSKVLGQFFADASDITRYLKKNNISIKAFFWVKLSIQLPRKGIA